MKKVKLFSLTIAVILSVFVANVWAGTVTYSYGSLLQGILGANELQGSAGPAGKTFTQSGEMKTVKVTGTFASSCLLVSRTLHILNENLQPISSLAIPNGKVDVTLPFPSNSPANKAYYLRIDVVRVNSTSNLGSLCGFGFSPSSGTAIFTYSP